MQKSARIIDALLKYQQKSLPHRGHQIFFHPVSLVDGKGGCSMICAYGPV